jgi:hypothetical protein
MPSKPKQVPGPPKGSEPFERFKELTRKLLAVPKKEADETKPVKKRSSKKLQ